MFQVDPSMEQYLRMPRTIGGGLPKRDEFADPFEDANFTGTTRAQARAVMEAAMNGASVATGSNTGMKILIPPRSTAPIVAGPAVDVNPPRSNPVIPFRYNDESGIATLQSKLAPSTTTPLRNLLTPSFEGPLRRIADISEEGQFGNNESYLKSLQERASKLGVYPDYQKILETDPDALHPSSLGDPRFAATAKGKIMAEAELPAIFNNPHFDKVYREDKTKASAIYKALTDRDLNTDIEAKTASIMEQASSRKKIMDELIRSGLKADPVTGKYTKTIRKADSTLGGEGFVLHDVALTPLEEAVVQKEGGTKKAIGVDLPNMGGIKLEGATEEENQAYRSLTKEFVQKGMSVAEASKQAHRQLYQQQQSRSTATTSIPKKEGGLRKTLEAITDVQIAGINAIPRFLNWGATRGATTSGLAAPFPTLPSASELEELTGKMTLQDVLAFWAEKTKGPYADVR